MEDSGRDFNSIIQVGVSGRRHSFQIIGDEGLAYAGFFEQINGFIVGDRRLCFRIVGSYVDISLYVYFYLIAQKTIVCGCLYTVIAVDDLYILIAQILIVSIDKTIISAFYSMIFTCMP